MRAAARRFSMRAVTGKPIKFAGVGEALDKLEAFHPERVAGRILGMGDVVSLVERAAETIQVEEAEKLAAKMAKGKFDLDDLWAQLRQMQRMGGLGALAGMMPGLKGMKGAMDKAQDSKALVHMEAMLSSMTAKERAQARVDQRQAQDPRRQGQGTTVQEINKLLKMHQEMATAMKRLKKMGGLGKLAAMFGKGGWKVRSAGLRLPVRCRPAACLASAGRRRSPASAAGLHSTCLRVSTNSQRSKRTH